MSDFVAPVPSWSNSQDELKAPMLNSWQPSHLSCGYRELQDIVFDHCLYDDPCQKTSECA